uniref:Exodeoxyribonuclease V beta subunit n=1 Tax=uncultured bacterium F42-01 TaxID=1191438 RepID=I3VIL5_9BACT|nr:exodeoxyribonuclease V beta subunit [uncultured bacterium F42-01]
MATDPCHHLGGTNALRREDRRLRCARRRSAGELAPAAARGPHLRSHLRPAAAGARKHLLVHEQSHRSGRAGGARRPDRVLGMALCPHHGALHPPHPRHDLRHDGVLEGGSAADLHRLAHPRSRAPGGRSGGGRGRHQAQPRCGPQTFGGGVARAHQARHRYSLRHNHQHRRLSSVLAPARRHRAIHHDLADCAHLLARGLAHRFHDLHPAPRLLPAPTRTQARKADGRTPQPGLWRLVLPAGASGHCAPQARLRHLPWLLAPRGLFHVSTEATVLPEGLVVPVLRGRLAPRRRDPRSHPRRNCPGRTGRARRRERVREAARARWGRGDAARAAIAHHLRGRGRTALLVLRGARAAAAELRTDHHPSAGQTRHAAPGGAAAVFGAGAGARSAGQRARAGNRAPGGDPCFHPPFRRRHRVAARRRAEAGRHLPRHAECGAGSRRLGCRELPRGSADRSRTRQSGGAHQPGCGTFDLGGTERRPGGDVA